jgi:hypothetical protein
MIICVSLIISIVFSIVGFIYNYKNNEKTYLYIYSGIFIISTGLLIFYLLKNTKSKQNRISPSPSPSPEIDKDDKITLNKVNELYKNFITFQEKQKTSKPNKEQIKQCIIDLENILKTYEIYKDNNLTKEDINQLINVYKKNDLKSLEKVPVKILQLLKPTTKCINKQNYIIN